MEIHPTTQNRNAIWKNRLLKRRIAPNCWFVPKARRDCPEHYPLANIRSVDIVRADGRPNRKVDGRGMSQRSEKVFCRAAEMGGEILQEGSGNRSTLLLCRQVLDSGGKRQCGIHQARDPRSSSQLDTVRHDQGSTVQYDLYRASKLPRSWPPGCGSATPHLRKDKETGSCEEPRTVAIFLRALTIQPDHSTRPHHHRLAPKN